MEFIPKTHIEKVKYYPDVNAGILTSVAELKGRGEFFAESFFDGRETGSACVFSEGGTTILSLPLKEKHLWKVGEGRLYTLYLRYGADKVKSYFGLRNIRLDGYKFLINETSVFQRLVLDQGGGILTEFIPRRAIKNYLRILNVPWRWDLTARGYTRKFSKSVFSIIAIKKDISFGANFRIGDWTFLIRIVFTVFFPNG